MKKRETKEGRAPFPWSESAMWERTQEFRPGLCASQQHSRSRSPERPQVVSCASRGGAEK